MTFDRNRSTSHTRVRAPSSPVHVRSCNHQLRHFFGPSPAELTTTTTTTDPRSATPPPSIAQSPCHVASLISKRCFHNSPRGFSYLHLSSTTSHTPARHGHPLPSHAHLRRANNANRDPPPETAHTREQHARRDCPHSRRRKSGRRRRALLHRRRAQPGPRVLHELPQAAVRERQPAAGSCGRVRGGEFGCYHREYVYTIMVMRGLVSCEGHVLMMMRRAGIDCLQLGRCDVVRR